MPVTIGMQAPIGPSLQTTHADREIGLARLNPVLADRGAAILLIATATFNAILALINGHGMHIGSGIVAGAQFAIVAAAVGMVLATRPAGSLRWLAYGWAAMLLFALMMLLRGELAPKTANDMILLPVFAAVGLCIRRNTFVKTVLGLQIALVFFALLELFRPVQFASIFHVADYYVQSRGFSQATFWTGNDLFLSSRRPGGRLLSMGFNVDRAGSLFLEPVGLGNWTIGVVVMLATFWKDLSRRDRVVLIVSVIVLLWACDGRLAMGVSAAIGLSIPLFSRLRWRWLPVAYLPITFVGLMALYSYTGVGQDATGDNLRGRYGYGVDLMKNLTLTKVLGLYRSTSLIAADAGWVNIIVSQSLFGLLLYWFGITVLSGRATRAGLFAHSAGIYIALALPVSFSVLSIKTAAMLWMMLGLAQRDGGIAGGASGRA